MRSELQTVLTGLRDLAAEELPALIGELESVKAAAWARLASPAPAPPQQHDELVHVTEAAKRLGMSEDYLYRHHARLPFTRREGRKLLFSALGIDKYIRNKAVRTY